MTAPVVQSAQAFLDANKERESAVTTCTYIAGLLDEIERLQAALVKVERILDRNLGHQTDKRYDALAIIRKAINPDRKGEP